MYTYYINMAFLKTIFCVFSCHVRNSNRPVPKHPDFKGDKKAIILRSRGAKSAIGPHCIASAPPRPFCDSILLETTSAFLSSLSLTHTRFQRLGSDVFGPNPQLQFFGASGCEMGFVKCFMKFPLFVGASRQLQYSQKVCGTLRLFCQNLLQSLTHHSVQYALFYQPVHS